MFALTAWLLLASAAAAPIREHAFDVPETPQEEEKMVDKLVHSVEHMHTAPETCTDLTNKGQYFSLKVEVGTPLEGTKPQVFELVADTGTPGVIVTSCVIVMSQMCNKQAKCFQGRNHSSTFGLKSAIVPEFEKTNRSKAALMGQPMTFGDAAMMSIIGSDVVSIGDTKATVHEGLLLMAERLNSCIEHGASKWNTYDKHAMTCDPSVIKKCLPSVFEGILGLGPPDKYRDPNSLEAELISAVDQETSVPETTLNAAPKVAAPKEDQPADGEKNQTAYPVVADKHYKSKIWMQEAGVKRYSMCFNDDGKPGAMRMNVPKFTQPLPSIGKYHWGLGLTGISVGDEKAEAILCGADTMNASQKQPCGGLPDSSTSLMLGPKDHVVKLYSALCDKWDRCKKVVDEKTPKHETFLELLHNCSDWRTKETGIDEVPSIFFNVGEKGNEQKLEFSAWSYIAETNEEIYEQVRRYAWGTIPVMVPKPTGKMRPVCVPQIGVQEYITKENGPIWTLGHPLFYQFNVGFELGEELQIGLTKDKCSACSDTKASLLETKSRAMRTLNDAPRVRHYESSMPF